MATTVKFVSVPSKTLAASINAAATSIQLSDILGWDGVALASANFGDVLWCVLRDSSNTFMEIMQLDPTTIANSSVTILKRGLDFSGGFTEVTANKLTWIKNDTIVELGSNPPQLLNQSVCVTGNQTIADLKIFTTLPYCTAVPVQAGDITNKAYVDSVVGGNANYDQNIVAGIAGENLTAALVAYLKASDGKWYVADSATASKSVGVELGIIQATVLSGVACRILRAGRDKTQTGLTAGLVYYLGVAGVLSTTKGANIRLIGQVPSGSTTDLIVDMQASGDPNVLLSDGSRTYVLDTGAADAYVATFVPAFTAYKTGQIFSVKILNTNTLSNPTLNVSGLGAKTIFKLNGSTVLNAGDLVAGQIADFKYDGTNMQLLSPAATTPQVDANGKFPTTKIYADHQTFTGSGTWTKPTGLTGNELVIVQCWAAGGGGAGTTGNGAIGLNGAGAAGGGAFVERHFRASDLGSTVTVTIGAAGTGGAAGLNDGVAGGNTTFGSLVTAYGGGGGFHGIGGSGTGGGGGSGGGNNAAGTTASSTSGTAGGGFGGGAASTESTNDSGGGGGGAVGASGGASATGGGGGAGGNSTGGSAHAGGASFNGGGGGGAGGGAGGTSIYGGSGGGSSANADGSAGTAPGGGGGGGTTNTSGTNRAGGNGARGECRVFVIAT